MSKIEEYYNDYSDNDDDNYLDFEVEFSDEIMEYRTDFTDRVNDKICEICNSVRLSKMFYVQGTPIDMARVKNVDKLVEQYDNKMIFHDYFFLLFDSTSFGNWKKGVLIASSGVYVKSGSPFHYYWPEFLEKEVYEHMSSLYIDGESVGNGPDTDKISDILNRLKIEMADMFCTDSAYDVCKVDDDMSLPKKSI